MSNSSSGIINIGQERVIPASRRPDGSVRKEIKVRQGYTPPEDVKKYQSKGQLIQERSQGYIAGLGSVQVDNSNKKNKGRQNDMEDLTLLMHGILQEMRLEDLRQILESFDDFPIDNVKSFDKVKSSTIQKILQGFGKDSKGIGEKIFSVSKITELKRFCGVLNLQESGGRNDLLERIHDSLKNRFKDVYTMYLIRPLDDFQSGKNIFL